MKGKYLVLILIIISVAGVIITWVLMQTLDLQPNENTIQTDIFDEQTAFIHHKQ